MYQCISKNSYSKNFRRIGIDTHKIQGNTRDINTIGGWFITDDDQNADPTVFAITPLHGRVAAHFHSENGWTLLKGVGWTYGGPKTLVSPKDPELFFGLCDEASAKREFEVSQWMVKNNIRVTPILGYAPINDQSIQDSAFRNGTPVKAVLLYTKVICPLRVMDLAYLNDAQKKEAIELTALACNWDVESFLECFFQTLANTVVEFQLLGGCNDTLDSNNVTLAAELTDFEWVSVPGIPLPWGDSTLELETRWQKEVIYLYEIGIQLAAFLNIKKPSNQLIEIISATYANNIPDILPIITALKSK